METGKGGPHDLGEEFDWSQMPGCDNHLPPKHESSVSRVASLRSHYHIEQVSFSHSEVGANPNQSLLGTEPTQASKANATLYKTGPQAQSQVSITEWMHALFDTVMYIN
ncbi:uncharacterized protein PgNI_06924 [Pyricularia grisea]|uniref:Uncharacterized protein n=1 Tax=Pyricularia grisea TaxID=148305 RepID=A0A6P8B341_PYRGI|nr:uncharacterized protein PgNI_06924 [Pyricularia grisea]TLD09330.1 hypothetical protein PgNI_06924 [Pyricularia grisea]